MNRALLHRSSALAGLVLAAALALWWLASMRLALERGSDAARPSAQLLLAAWMLRGMVVALVGVRVGALCGWRAGASSGLALMVPAWPLIVLAGSASALPWSRMALLEITLLAAATALPLIGLGLRRLLLQAEWVDVVAATIGIALAAAVWWVPLPWFGAPS